MSKEYLIHQYLDTGLEQSGEQELFTALAGDPLLRQEFTRQLKMKNLLEEESRKITPPAALSSAIFGELGYAIPAGMTTAATAVPLMHKLFPILGSLAALLFVGLLSVTISQNSEGIISSAERLLFVSDGELDIPFAANSEGNLQDASVDGSSSIGQNSVIESGTESSDNSFVLLVADSLKLLKSELLIAEGKIRNQRESITSLESRLRNSIAANSDGKIANRNASNMNGSNLANEKNIGSGSDIFAFDFTMDDILSDNKSTENSGGNITFIDMLTTSVKKRLSEVMSSDGYKKSIEEQDKTRNKNDKDLANQNSQDNGGFTENAMYEKRKPYDNPSFGDVLVMVNFVQTTSNPNVSMDGTPVPLSLDASMNLNGYFSVVAEVGMESYGQRFDFVQNGREVIRNQNPTVYYYTGGLRAATPYIFDSFMPYAQLTAGGSSFGPMVRAGVGSMFRTNEMFSINIGYDASMLWYEALGTGYSTTNQGYSFGLVLHF